MRTEYRVAVLTTLNLKGHRNVVSGIFEFAHRRKDWSVFILEGREGEQRIDPCALECNGIIAINQIPSEVKMQIRRHRIPCVVVEPYDTKALPETVSYIRRDSEAIGRFAAEYYLKRRYTSFAYVDVNRPIYWSDDRLRGFSQTVGAAGYKVLVHRPVGKKGSENWAAERPQLIDFLRSLPKPTAVFTAMDGRARLVLDACRYAGIRVPEEIAVLGVDNDDIICRSTFPLLSSIDLKDEVPSTEASVMLMELMAGKRVSPQLITTRLRVVERQSTGYAAMMNPYVSASIRLIEARAPTENITVLDVVKAVNCSRRYLEILFRDGIGISVKEMIVDVKLKRVCSLLQETNLSLGDIAFEVGFANDSHLARLFKRRFGSTMREWRTRHSFPR